MDIYQQPSKPKSARPIVLGIISILITLLVGYELFAQRDSTLLVTKAVVVLKGNSQVTGTVFFEQASWSAPVKITGNLRNLDPNALRGFHVHQTGDATNGCVSAGAHFNPFGKTHGAPSDKERHVGDLGNVQSDEAGEANFSFEDTVISLNGPRSIIGRSIVIHAGTDDLGRGDNEESLRTGNAGGRAACGVIGFA